MERSPNRIEVPNQPVPYKLKYENDEINNRFNHANI